MNLKLTTHSSEETIALGELLGAMLKPGDVLAMRGTLAAGKTTITKGIAKALGVTDNITSPTFCIISEYEGAKMPLYHMDVYRLVNAEDFINLGVDDLIYGNGLSIIEWSEKIQSELPKKTITVQITPNEDSTRTIELINWPYQEIKLENK